MDEIPLARPDITRHEIELVTQVLRSGRLAMGPMQERFEELVAARAGRRYAVACSSGTAGLHMALIGLGVKPGDEVITTPLSFIAPANAILYVGATPVFVDVCPRSLNLDPARLEAAITSRTKAIIAVENFGNPEHMDAYRAIANRNEVRLIEDCCEAIGAVHKGRPAGSFGHVGVFGFYPNKQITTGEGGVVVTDDDRLASVLRSLRNQGRPDRPAGGALGSKMAFERLGYNFRLSELHAALGVAQMDRLDAILARRQGVAQRYIERLMTQPDVILPNVHEATEMSWFTFVVRLSDEYTAEERDRIIAGMHRHDVGAAAYFPCTHLQPHFANRPGCGEGAFPISESVAKRTIGLPFFTGMSLDDVDFVASTLELMIGRENLSRS